MPTYRHKPKIYALTSATGGVGKTTIAIELAKQFAQNQAKTVIVDFCAERLDTPILLGCDDNLNQREQVATTTPNLFYVPITIDNNFKINIVEQFLQSQKADVILLDLPTGWHDILAPLIQLAELTLIIGTAEPANLHATTHWLRRLITHALATHDLRLPIRWWLNDLITALDNDEQRIAAAETIAKLRIGYCLNQRRELSERQQSASLCHAWGAALGASPITLPDIKFEERRWFFVRGLGQASQYVLNDTIIPDIESLRIAFENLPPRIISGLLIAPETHPRAYLNASAAQNVRKAYRLLWEGYRREKGLVSTMLPTSLLAEIIDKIELAYQRSHATEDAGLPQINAPKTVPKKSQPQIPKSDVTIEDSENLRPLLKRRLALKISVQQLAHQARVPTFLLRQIEQNLPTPGLSTSYRAAYVQSIEECLARLEKSHAP